MPLLFVIPFSLLAGAYLDNKVTDNQYGEGYYNPNVTPNLFSAGNITKFAVVGVTSFLIFKVYKGIVK